MRHRRARRPHVVGDRLLRDDAPGHPLPDPADQRAVAVRRRAGTRRGRSRRGPPVPGTPAGARGASDRRSAAFWFRTAKMTVSLAGHDHRRRDRGQDEPSCSSASAPGVTTPPGSRGSGPRRSPSPGAAAARHAGRRQAFAEGTGPRRSARVGQEQRAVHGVPQDAEALGRAGRAPSPSAAARNTPTSLPKTGHVFRNRRSVASPGPRRGRGRASGRGAREQDEAAEERPAARAPDPPGTAPALRARPTPRLSPRRRQADHEREDPGEGEDRLERQRQRRALPRSRGPEPAGPPVRAPADQRQEARQVGHERGHVGARLRRRLGELREGSARTTAAQTAPSADSRRASRQVSHDGRRRPESTITPRAAK